MNGIRSFFGYAVDSWRGLSILSLDVPVRLVRVLLAKVVAQREYVARSLLNGTHPVGHVSSRKG
jgi:hypothetical protein